MRLAHKFAMALAVTLGSVSSAVGQSGPVATACKDDIARYCADKEHGHGEVRACLEAHKDKVSATCRDALETTRGGR